MENEKIWGIYSTFPTQSEALSAARKLLEENLIACANCLPGMVSLYRWQGDIQQESEVALLAKTSALRYPQAIERLATIHPYDIPCIVAFPIAEGHAPFIGWVCGQTA
jgi:periplasmic divalent cation tolerance protein